MYNILKLSQLPYSENKHAKCLSFLKKHKKSTFNDGCHWASNKEVLGSYSQQWIPAAVSILTRVYRNEPLMSTAQVRQVHTVEGEKNSKHRSAKLTKTTDLYHNNVKTLRGSSKKTEILHVTDGEKSIPNLNCSPRCVIYRLSALALFPAIKTEKLETSLFLHARNICISQYALYIFSHFLGTGNGPQIPS